MKSTAIVLSAGKGSRMKSNVPKQYMEICGKPIIYYTLKAFQESEVDEIVLVVDPTYTEFCENEIVNRYNLSKIKKIVAGGRERYESVFNGLRELETDVVLIHDGARPFVTTEVINTSIKEASECGAVICGVKSKDTIKITDENGYVVSTTNRSNTWITQTPQSFKYEIVFDAYSKLMEEDHASKGITDDAMVVELYGKCPVKFIDGGYNNIKITTVEDLEISASILSK